MWGEAYACRERWNCWGYLWRLATLLDHLVLLPNWARLTTMRHWGTRVALQTEPENMLRRLVHGQKPPTSEYPCLFPSIPPGEGESMSGQMCGSTFCGSHLSESGEISTDSNIFLFLLLWRVLHSSKGLLLSHFYQPPAIKGSLERLPSGTDICSVRPLHSQLLYLEWELSRF